MNTRALLVCTAVLILFSCSKELEEILPDPLFPSQATFKTSVFIQVVDSSGKSLSDVDVRLGNEFKTTDFDGWVLLKDIKVGSSAYITIEKEGYFNSSRRFYPSSKAPSYIRMILLPKSEKIVFDSSSGQISSLGQNFFLDFPKDAYQSENGDEYNGEVTVVSQILSMDDPDMSYKMPGDLTGISGNGFTGTLGSMGMVEVELRASDGNKLKIIDGMKVGIEFPVAAERINLVPPTMPMWYFDESSGVWREEGLAILQGNHYVGSVSHFSFWNCDAFFSMVNWHGKFFHSNDAPIAFGQVCITIDRLQSRRCDYINQAGEIIGKVAANEVMTMEVYSNCGDLVYTAAIGPYAQDAMEGPIAISDQSFYCHVSGRVLDCNQHPIHDGYLICVQGDKYYGVEVDHDSGSFSLSINGCTDDDLRFQAFDRNTSAISVVYFSAFAPEIKLDTIQVCQQGGKSGEYIYFETPQLNHSFISTNINFKGSGQDCNAVIESEDALHEFAICLKNRDEGIYSDSECWIELQLNPSERAISNKIDLLITDSGRHGGFIKGSFKGDFITTDSSQFMSTHFKGEFRVRMD
jgi:hypothetical protein